MTLRDHAERCNASDGARAQTAQRDSQRDYFVRLKR